MYYRISIRIVFVLFFLIPLANFSCISAPIIQSPHNGKMSLPMDDDFIFIKGGCYKMGDTWGDGEMDEQPVHEVCVGSFFINKYEVTQGQWEDLMGSNPAKFRAGYNYPVENVSRSDINEFINKLNRRNHDAYRLPTEAEWEYAAKSSSAPVKFATESGELNQDLCNYDGTGSHNIWSRTSPVGSFPPNKSGLYDMCGNVWELVEDNYHFSAYEQHERTNTLYTDSSSERVARGCGWSDSMEDCRISIRSKVSQDCPVCSRRNDTGFRLVKDY